ncbi:hypothetical protein KC19_1G216400 [Ceratodon purpureus]|uniref:Uncharacterized protein n=1 Tax=Ceratodon purpureus TaxID=3225 RepID=A0A8T0JBA8_CERPU|nr:hypothetical protein KC19_1G216400 [Ceratodon purpureus]
MNATSLSKVPGSFNPHAYYSLSHNFSKISAGILIVFIGHEACQLIIVFKSLLVGDLSGPPTGWNLLQQHANDSAKVLRVLIKVLGVLFGDFITQEPLGLAVKGQFLLPIKMLELLQPATVGCREHRIT